MTGALLAVAAAALVWPLPGAGRRPARRLDPRAPRLRPELEVLPVPALAGGAAAAVAAVVSTALVAALAAVLATVAARAWLARRRADRLGAALSSLVEGLGALAAELRSGRSLIAATDAAVMACADERCGRALALAVRDPGSLPAAHAAGGTDQRVLDEALRSVSSAVLLSTRTGCSLAGVLSAVEDDLRARRRHRDELRAATAGPAASALVLAGLPALGLAMGSGVGADPWRVLTTTGTGQILLVSGVALELAGLAWSRRLIQRAVR